MRHRVSDSLSPRLLPWQLAKAWARLPSFKGRDRLLYLGRRFLTDPKDLIVVRSKHGFEILADLGDEIDAEIYVFSEYDELTSRWIGALVGPGDVVIDVGANIGYFALLSARQVGPSGRVIAFEPLSRSFERLQQNLRRNPTLPIQAVNAAAGRADMLGQMIQPSEHRSGDAALLADGVAEDGAAVVEVRIASLDRWCADYGTTPTLVKIDVEGYELDVIEGARKTLAKALPALIIEVNGSALRRFGRSPGALTEVLAGLGYTVWRWQGSSLVPVNSREPSTNWNENVLCLAEGKHDQVRSVVEAACQRRPLRATPEIWPVPRTSVIQRL